MSRPARGSASLFTFDLDVLQRITAGANASKKQMEMAYSRALSRTVITLRKQALALIKQGLSPKGLDRVRRRMLAIRRSGKGTDVDEFKMWLGLNPIKVKYLNGRIKGKPLPHHAYRDARGRYADNPQPAPAPEFMPKGAMLSPVTYPGGKVRPDRTGRTTIVTAEGRDAEVDIYDALHTRIEDEIFTEAVAIFMHHFETDLRGRVNANIR